MFNHKNTLDYKTCTRVGKVDKNCYATIVAATGSAGNWSSGSAWVGGVAPTAADDAQITTLTTSITIDATALCRSADFTGCTGTVTFGSTGVLTIGDGTAGLTGIALKFVTGMTCSPNIASQVVFVSSATSQQTVDFGGKSMGVVNFNGAGSNYALIRASTTQGILTVTQGSFHSDGASDTSGFSHTFGGFNSSNSNTRSVTFGTSSITISNAANNGLFTVATATNLTFSAASSTLNLNTGNGVTHATNNKTYGTITVNNAATSGVTLNGFTCTTFTMTGFAGKIESLRFTNNVTITGTFTCNGNSITNRVLIFAVTAGTAITISAATVVFQYVDFQDITAGGAANWNLTGQSINSFGDCGGNTGITFTTSSTQTATMGTSKSWSDVTIWTSRVPLPQDDVLLSSVTGGTLTADMPRLGRSIDWTGATGTPVWANSVVQSMFGSLTLVAGMTTSGTNQLTLAGRSTYTLTTAGITFTQGLTVACPTGTYTLQDNLTDSRSAASAFSLTSGTFTDNGKRLGFTGTSATIAISGGTLNATGTWNSGCTAAATFWNCTGGTVNASSSTILLTTASSNTRTFAGNGKTYGTLDYTITASSGTLSITGSNTFSNIKFYDLG